MTDKIIFAAERRMGPNAPVFWQKGILYHFPAILSGLAFWVMGGSYGSRFNVFGLAFFILSLLMLLHLPWAPLEFGLFWAASLAAIGCHLRQLGAEAATEPRSHAPAWEPGLANLKKNGWRRAHIPTHLPGSSSATPAHVAHVPNSGKM